MRGGHRGGRRSAEHRDAAERVVTQGTAHRQLACPPAGQEGSILALVQRERMGRRAMAPVGSERRVAVIGRAPAEQREADLPSGALLVAAARRDAGQELPLGAEAGAHRLTPVVLLAFQIGAQREPRPPGVGQPRHQRQRPDPDPAGMQAMERGAAERRLAEMGARRPERQPRRRPRQHAGRPIDHALARDAAREARGREPEAQQPAAPAGGRGGRGRPAMLALDREAADRPGPGDARAGRPELTVGEREEQIASVTSADRGRVPERGIGALDGGDALVPEERQGTLGGRQGRRQQRGAERQGRGPAGAA